MRTSLRKAIYVLLPLIIYVVVHDIVRLLLMYIVQVSSTISQGFYGVISSHEAVTSGVMTMIEMLAGAAVLLFVMKRDDWELSIADYVNWNTISFYRADKIHKAWVSYAILVLQAISAAIGLNALIFLTGLAKVSENSSKAYSLPLVFGVLLYGVVSPAVEELLHRIIIFGRMKRCFPYVISVIVSSLFFGLYHMNLVQMIYGTLMGILMCLACEYVHTVWGAFLVHSIANLTVYILSSIGKFSNLGNVSACIVCLALALGTLVFELYYSHKSARTIGVPYGVERVGLFFVDETIYEESIEDER